jgi:hypothetical protein
MTDKIFYVNFLDNPYAKEIYITHISPEFQNDHGAMREIVLDHISRGKHRHTPIESIILMKDDENVFIYQHFNHPKPESMLDEELFKI